MISQAKLKRLVRYNHRTGDFTCRVQRGNRKAGDVLGTNCNGYLTFTVCGVHDYAHRWAYFYKFGYFPWFELDHKDTNKANNRWTNIRRATRAINNQNLRKAQKNNKTGLLGVSKDHNSFRATIYAGKQLQVGNYSTPRLASAAYKKAKRELHSGCTL